MPRKKAIPASRKKRFKNFLQEKTDVLFPTPQKKKVALLLALLILGALISVFLMWHYIHTDDVVGNQVQTEGSEEVLKILSNMMLLPAEEPVMYSIDNPGALQGGQPFFAGSMVGDYLIIYPNVAKAIIYSPSREMIVNVGPVTFDTPAENNSQEEEDGTEEERNEVDTEMQEEESLENTS